MIRIIGLALLAKLLTLTAPAIVQAQDSQGPKVDGDWVIQPQQPNVGSEHDDPDAKARRIEKRRGAIPADPGPDAATLWGGEAPNGKDGRTERRSRGGVRTSKNTELATGGGSEPVDEGTGKRESGGGKSGGKDTGGKDSGGKDSGGTKAGDANSGDSGAGGASTGDTGTGGTGTDSTSTGDRNAGNTNSGTSSSSGRDQATGNSGNSGSRSESGRDR